MRVDLRAPESDVHTWKQEALAAGMTLSAWIRARCSVAAVPGSNPGRVEGAREPDSGKSAAEASVIPQDFSYGLLSVNEILVEPSDSEGRSDDHRAVVSESGGEVRRDGGRKSDAAGGVAKRSIRVCGHGTKAGWHCWQCGGRARVG